MFRRILLLLLVFIIVLVAFVLFRTFSFDSRQLQIEPAKLEDIRNSSLDRFSRALQIKTVSPENKADFDSIQFTAFNRFLEESYPLTDSLLEHQTFNEFSHLFTWKGSDPDLKPAVLMAHLDVVPVIEENMKYWKADPFGGEVKNDTIWGRGSIDDKVSAVSLMEAVETLLEKGFQPSRTYYIALGHDEEIVF